MLHDENKFYWTKTLYFPNKRWLFDKVYNDYIASKALSLGYHTTFKTLDKGFIEIIGPAGIMQICTQTMRQVSQLQSGYIYHYAFLMLCGVGVCIILVSFGILFLHGWILVFMDFSCSVLFLTMHVKQLSQHIYSLIL